LGALKGIRAERDTDKAYKKLREAALKKYSHVRSSLGFAGAAMLGMAEEDESQRPGQHTKPANFMMSKQQQNDQSMNSTMYDDTGRGLRSMEVQRLLDKAKLVIDKENKKAVKELMKKTQGASSIGTKYKSAKSHMSQSKTMGMTNMTGGPMSSKMPGSDVMGSDDDEDKEEKRLRDRKIPPFSFDIDDDIDTEVLVNEQVYDDLK